LGNFYETETISNFFTAVSEWINRGALLDIRYCFNEQRPPGGKAAFIRSWTKHLKESAR
jgi:hypothetical protein